MKPSAIIRLAMAQLEQTPKSPNRDYFCNFLVLDWARPEEVSRYDLHEVQDLIEHALDEQAHENGYGPCCTFLGLAENLGWVKGPVGNLNIRLSNGFYEPGSLYFNLRRDWMLKLADKLEAQGK